MRWAGVLVLLVLLEVCLGDDVCLPTISNCNNSIGLYGDAPVVMPCSVASGTFPLLSGNLATLSWLPTLPLYYQGNFDLCETFDSAHYCSIKTGPLGIPLAGLTPATDVFPPRNILPLGDFRMDACVSKECTSDMLRKRIEGLIKTLAEYIVQIYPNASAQAMANLIRKDLRVSCIDDVEEKLDAAGVFTVSILFVAIGTMILATFLHSYRPEQDFPKLIGWFSAKRNVAKLLAEVPGDFTAFNGIRVFSMMWIITGHCLLNYTNPPPTNINALQKLALSYEFALLRGAEYAVDTFFLMSGFLAALGLLSQLRKRGLTAASYFMMVIARYLRLTPAYAFVLFMFWKVMPTLSSGPLWQEQFNNPHDGATWCNDHWWINLLYLNNLVPFGDHMQCAGWTWYLACDFQFFLLAPVIVSLFIIGERTKNKWYKYGPCLFLICVQILSMSITMHLNDMNGNQAPFTKGSRLFWSHVYQAPWCRVTPYAVGTLMALMHSERVERCTAEGRDWKDFGWTLRLNERFSLGTANLAFALFIAALGGMFGLVSAHYGQYKCETRHVDCYAWAGLYYNGFFALQNWSQGFAILFYTFSYGIWSVCFGTVCYCMFAGHLPMTNGFLSHPVFTPLARLTYVAYLCHIPIQLLLNYSQHSLPQFAGWNVVSQIISYVVVAYSLSFFIFHIIEKPCMNMVTFLLFQLQGGKKDRPSRTEPSTLDTSALAEAPLLQAGQGASRDTRAVSFEARRADLDRQISTITDIDNEAVAIATPHVEGRTPAAHAAMEEAANRF